MKTMFTKAITALFLALSLHSYAAVQFEDFSDASWLNHEDLSGDVTVGDLHISVDAGASLKGFTTPHGLMPGYNTEAPAYELTISPSSTEQYINLKSFGVTDLFIMDYPSIKVQGIKEGSVVKEIIVSELWSDITKSGTVTLTDEFNELTSIRFINETPTAEIYFILDNIEYELTAIVPTDPLPQNKFGAVNFFTLLIISCLYRRKQQQATSRSYI